MRESMRARPFRKVFVTLDLDRHPRARQYQHAGGGMANWLGDGKRGESESKPTFGAKSVPTLHSLFAMSTEPWPLCKMEAGINVRASLIPWYPE